jgi:hypothetical protein
MQIRSYFVHLTMIKTKFKTYIICLRLIIFKKLYYVVVM